MSRKIYGVGVNDADYVVRNKDFFCPYYQRWANMLKRCYSSNQPTYIDCIVNEEWLTFSNFREWMKKQDWVDKHLDKDLLVFRNKEYNKDACIFIDRELNNFLERRDSMRNNLPLGVSLYGYDDNKYISQISNPFKDSRGHLGVFNTVMEAHKSWQIEKIKYTDRYIEIYKDDENVLKGLNRIKYKISEDLKNNIITEYF